MAAPLSLRKCLQARGVDTSGGIRTVMHSASVTNVRALCKVPRLLTLAKTVSPDPATVGQPLTFTLTVINTAPPSPVHILQTPLVVDTLPPGMTVVSVTPGPGATPPFCNINSGTVTCRFRDLNNGESARANIVAIPIQSGSFTNTARGTFDAGTVPADFSVQD